MVNLSRHIKLCHPDASPIPLLPKGRKQEGKRNYKGRLQCSLCSSATIRMDVHLKVVHKLVKGTRTFEEALQEAVPLMETGQQSEDLNKALVDYG